MQGYDIIGDIHGRERELRALLHKLDYRTEDGVWHHPRRKALFLGDFIDRNPARGVLGIVRPMVEAGTAVAIMGNHEMNAIGFHQPHPEIPGEHLRPRIEKNLKQHKLFRDEFAGDPDALDETIDWFKTLPLWLDLGNARAVHATWHEPSLAELERWTDQGNRLTEEGILNVHRKGSDAADAMEKVLKGMEMPLPGGHSFLDKDKNPRHKVRLRWWRNEAALPWKEAAVGPQAMRRQLPDTEVAMPESIGYPETHPPVFFGHYWWTGQPAPLADNVACLDYSAGRGGKLVAYRWSGEQVLSEANFVCVNTQAA